MSNLGRPYQSLQARRKREIESLSRLRGSVLIHEMDDRERVSAIEHIDALLAYLARAE